jgi:hypothetical protein
MQTVALNKLVHAAPELGDAQIPNIFNKRFNFISI